MKLWVPLLLGEIALACTIVVEYPSCYYLQNSYISGSSKILLFQRNSFFKGCPTVHGRLAVQIPEYMDIRVYLDNKLYKIYRGSELCS